MTVAEFRRSEILLTPSDVPWWRRELVDWYGRQGVEWFRTMIAMGKQSIRPAVQHPRVAEILNAYEIRRLADSSLWFIDGETCDLVGAAHESMPAFAPVETDLPSKCGFALFRKPVIIRDPSQDQDMDISDLVTGLSLMNATRDEARTIREVRELMESSNRSMGAVIDSMADVGGNGDPEKADGIRKTLSRICDLDLYNTQVALLGHQVKIVGVSWSPAVVQGDPRFPAGGVWISFYSWSNLDHVIADPAVRSRYKQLVPDLMIDNEAVVPWYPGEGDREPFVLSPESLTTYGWARMVFATFRVGAQRGLCEHHQERTPRPERRRTEKAGLAPRDVTVVRLRSRRTTGGSPTEPGRKHGHRYPVRGHWRSQWYPSVKDNRPIWIDPHIRGPEGAELIVGERVTVM